MITRALRTRPWTWLVGRLRWSGPLLTAHGEPEHARAMARGAVYLYTSGGLLVFLVLALPRPEAHAAGPIAALGAAGLLGAIANVLVFDRLLIAGFHVAGWIGAALVALAVTLAGEAGAAYAFVFVWIVLYAFFFYRLHIGVESELGVETTLTVHLPLAAGRVAPAEAPAERQAEARRELVLLVEDDELVRSLVGQALVGHGYEVAAASGGAEALELFHASAEPPALVVTDIVMPGINGAELARALRERRPGLPVLFTSGYAKQLIDERDLHDGTAFLPKPFSIADVSAAVRSLLAGGRRREGAGEVLARAGGAF